MSRCEAMLADLTLIDAEFGPTLQRDTEGFCRASIGMVEASNVETYSSTAQGNSYCVPSPGALLRSHMDTLIRVHGASGSGSHMRAYKLRGIPNDVLHGLEAKKSSKSRRTKLGYYIAAMGACEEANGLPLFGDTRDPGEFLRLEIEAPKHIRLTEGKDCFARMNASRYIRNTLRER